MSFTRLQLQSSRETDRATFRPAPTKMGYTRAVFSALSILFGTFMYYVAMHYVPALANPRQILKLATESQTLPPSEVDFKFEDQSALEKIMGPYYNLFALDRAYMRAGESIAIKYDLPQNATAHLDIVQCRRFWVIEIFNCKVVSQFGTSKTAGQGIATFALKDPGFYHFRHRVDGLDETQSYRLIWERR